MIAAGRDSWLNRRLLAHPTMVYIGLISYPLYLWHWPMLSFGRILHGGPPVAAVRLAIVAASVAAASLTYHLVDKPIRFGAHTARRLAFVVLATVLVGGAGLLVTFNKGFPTRNADVAMIYRLFNDLDLQETAVTVPPCGSALASLGDCAISDPLAKPTAAVIGDSHARRLFMGLAPALKHRGENLLSLSCSRCVPFYGLFPSNYTYESTAARIRASLDFIATERSIRTVYIMSRGPAYTTGLGFGPADFPDQFHLIHAGHPRDTVDAKNFADGMRRTLRRLVDAGKQVVFVDAVPELDFAPRDCFSPWPRERHVPCELSAAGYRQRNAAYLALVASVLAEFPGVRQFSPAKYLCDDIRCPVIRSGQVVYLDSNHLSLWGGTFVAGFLVSATSGDPAAVARPPARP